MKAQNGLPSKNEEIMATHCEPEFWQPPKYMFVWLNDWSWVHRNQEANQENQKVKLQLIWATETNPFDMNHEILICS